MLSPQIKKVIQIFSEFPTVGERTATRFTLYLLSLPKEKVEEICDNILTLKTEIKTCHYCFSPFQPKENEEICEVCRNEKREKILCVVERESDFWQMEKAQKYQGYYFILGEKIDFLTENALGKMRIEELKKRVENLKPREIILALNPTADGILTMNYLTRTLKNIEITDKKTAVKISRLGQGLPIGGELEYADEETLKIALEERK